MSATLISRSPELKRLQDEGYEVEIREAHLLIGHVPYVTERRTVAYGTLVSTLTLAVTSPRRRTRTSSISSARRRATATGDGLTNSSTTRRRARSRRAST
jgi:hypothetical protein